MINNYNCFLSLLQNHVTNKKDNGLPPLRNAPLKQHVSNREERPNGESLTFSSKQQTKSEEITTPSREDSPPPSYNQENSK